MQPSTRAEGNSAGQIFSLNCHRSDVGQNIQGMWTVSHKLIYAREVLRPLMRNLRLRRLPQRGEAVPLDEEHAARAGWLLQARLLWH